MTIDVRIIDSETKQHAHVNGEGEVSVVVHPHPPVDEAVTTLPFRQHFTDNGKSTGSSDMLVNGSVTNVDFYIEASPDYDIYIKTVSAIIADNGAVLDKFGAITALTNGIEFTHNTLANGTEVLHEGIKTNLDFVRLGQNSPAIGDGASAFRADINGGGADTYLPIIDFSIIFGMTWGLRLQKSSTDNLKFTVRDDITLPDQFDIIAYGIKT